MADAALPRLRPARPEEKGALLALLEAAFRTYDTRLGRPFPPDVGRRLANAIDGRLVHVADVDGAPAALLWIALHQDAVHIDRVAVAPHLQGKGIGSHVMAQAADLARAGGRVLLRLHTAAVMPELVEFYRRHGFIETRRAQHPERGDGHVRVFMEKRLA